MICALRRARTAFCRQNVPVTDVSIYVALITGGAGALGAATPQLATVLRDSRQAGRDRRERGVNARRQAYVELLGAAADLRTRVDHHETTNRLIRMAGGQRRSPRRANHDWQLARLWFD